MAAARIIGITGGIGSGKSTIAAELHRMGYAVYDTDREAKRLIVHDAEVRRQLTQLLGDDIYEGDTYLTRVVAERVFAQPDLLARLNAIVHPAVRSDILRYAESLPEHLLFVESAILIESGLVDLCSAVVLITAPLEVRISRTMQRDDADINKVRARIHAQTDDDTRRRYANLVICNDGHTPIPTLAEQIITNYDKNIEKFAHIKKKS